MDEHRRQHKFSWSLIGDITNGRPNLGPMTRLENYRLMQATFRDVMEQQFGTQKAEEVCYQAGELAGRQFYQYYIGKNLNFQEVINQLRILLQEMHIGILRVEESDFNTGRFVITVAEDLECSGLPEVNYKYCTYDEGFIAGILESFVGKKVTVTEMDCWCTGERICRFVAIVVDPK